MINLTTSATMSPKIHTIRGLAVMLDRELTELFQKSRFTVNEHILNIYEEDELQKDVSMRKIGNSDFTTKPTNNLNVTVGYDWILSKTKKV